MSFDGISFREWLVTPSLEGAVVWVAGCLLYLCAPVDRKRRWYEMVGFGFAVVVLTAAVQ